MARSIVWPQVAPPVAAPQPDRPDSLDLTGLAATFGPELARRMGLRVTAAPGGDDGAATETDILLGAVPLAANPAGIRIIHIGCQSRTGALLLERLFGARGHDAAAAADSELLRLPPGSASWSALCRTVTSALSGAMAAVGQPIGGSPELPTRAVPLPAGGRLYLQLDIEGAVCRVALVPEAARSDGAEKAGPDPVAFRQAARARALELELPVALRVAEQRIPLAQALRLSVGDVVPIDPLPMPDVLAGGRRIARLPASAFSRAGGRSAPDTEEDAQ